MPAMPEAQLLYSVTGVVIVGLVAWVGWALTTAKEPWAVPRPAGVDDDAPPPSAEAKAPKVAEDADDDEDEEDEVADTPPSKKSDEKKSDEKKSDEKKSDEKKADEKKSDEKKADADTTVEATAVVVPKSDDET